MKKMTKLLALLLALCMALAMTACGDKPVDPDTPENPGVEEPGNTEPTFAEQLKDIQKTMLEDMLALQQENKDTMGWLYIDGTEVNEAVVKVDYNDNNQYYLRRNSLGERDNDGCFYADFRSNRGGRDDLSKNTVIYGHNLGREGDSSLTTYDNYDDGPKFAQLLKYQDEEFAKNHPYICFSTFDADMVWEVFAVYYTPTSFKYHNPNPTDAEFSSMIAKAQDLSFYDYDVVVTGEDKILTLSTCTYRLADGTKLHYPNDYRYVIMARLVAADAELQEEATFMVTENAPSKAAAANETEQKADPPAAA